MKQTELRVGDWVIVEGPRVKKFTGYIVGESRSGTQWYVVKDGRESVEHYHKSYCTAAFRGEGVR